MSSRVDPGQLRAYSTQLHRNADALETLTSYCDRHCTDTAGLTGMLWAAGIPAVRGFAAIQRRVLPAGREHLDTTADLLELSARRYAEGDRAAADRMWTVSPAWRADSLHREGEHRGHAGDYHDPATVDPEPPTARDELAKKVERVNSLVKEIDHWIQKVAPELSLHDRVMPWLTGDFGRLREIADGYAALSGGARAIDANLIHGMDSLSTAWDGDAAAAFDYHVRRRWHDALVCEAAICTACAEGLQWLAREAENAFLLLETLLIAALLAVGAKVMRIIAAALSGVGLAKAAHWLTELYHWFHQLVDYIKLVFTLVPAAWRRLEEMYEAIAAEVPALMSLMRGDLAAITRG